MFWSRSRSVPLAVWRSTSTVGFPRESKISRAQIFSIDMMSGISLGGREVRIKVRGLEGRSLRSVGGARSWAGWESGYCSGWGVGRSRLLPSAVEAVEGIPPTPPSGREGHCSEEGEVTAVGGGVTPNVGVGGHRSEE